MNAIDTLISNPVMGHHTGLDRPAIAIVIRGGITASPAYQHICPAQAVQYIIAAIADQHIIIERAVQIFDSFQDIAIRMTTRADILRPIAQR